MNCLRMWRSCIASLAQIARITQQCTISPDLHHQWTLRRRTDMTAAADLEIGLATGADPDWPPLLLDVIETRLGCTAEADTPRLVQCCFSTLAAQLFLHSCVDHAQRGAPVIEFKQSGSASHAADGTVE